MYCNGRFRSLLKAISWRVLATTITLLTVWGFTKRLYFAVGVSVVDGIIKMVVYYFHERGWNKSMWGRSL